MQKRICVIGGGRWGLNHIKTLFQMENLTGIVESDPVRLTDLLKQFPVQGFNNIEDAMGVPFDGYILVTPAETHYAIGKRLLERGLNVLIEKPMTIKSEQSEELVRIAEKSGSRLMVGHVLLFHPAIRKIKELLDGGIIGKLCYVYSTRLNFGTVRTEENVFTSFAPHDISVLDYLIGKPAIKIVANSGKFLNNKICDYAMAHLVYPENVHAHIFVSWLHPFKEQRLVLTGSNGMISFDDSSKEKEICFYQKRIEFANGIPIKFEQPDEVIFYDRKMPLTEELTYFIGHLDKTIEVANGKSGVEVVRILEAVENEFNK